MCVSRMAALSIAFIWAALRLSRPKPATSITAQRISTLRDMILRNGLSGGANGVCKGRKKIMS